MISQEQAFTLMRQAVAEIEAANLSAAALAAGITGVSPDHGRDVELTEWGAMAMVKAARLNTHLSEIVLLANGKTTPPPQEKTFDVRVTAAPTTGGVHSIRNGAAPNE